MCAESTIIVNAILILMYALNESNQNATRQTCQKNIKKKIGYTTEDKKQLQQKLKIKDMSNLFDD